MRITKFFVILFLILDPGSGVIIASTVSADDIRVDDLEAASVTCQRLIAKRVQTPELFAFESVAVSCFLSSAYVATGKLTRSEELV